MLGEVGVLLLGVVGVVGVVDVALGPIVVVIGIVTVSLVQPADLVVTLEFIRFKGGSSKSPQSWTGKLILFSG